MNLGKFLENEVKQMHGKTGKLQEEVNQQEPFANFPYNRIFR